MGFAMWFNEVVVQIDQFFDSKLGALELAGWSYWEDAYEAGDTPAEALNDAFESADPDLRRAWLAR